MKKSLFLFTLLPFFIQAQVLKPNQSQLNFGNVNVGDVDSLQLVINNNYQSAITITGFKFYTIYNEVPFSVKQQNFTIPYQGSASVWVYFEPRQNILHNSEMIIQHNGTSAFEPIDLIGQGKFPMTYYNSTENLSEEALKTALKTRLGQGYNSLSYSGARDQMYGSIDNNGGSVECAYTGRTANFNTRAGANNNNFNCEHTFPQGFFNSNLPMRSDIHHLFSTDITANGQRGNLPFGIVSGSGSWSVGGSKKNSSTFEPRDAQKGRTARAMMYFVIRYQDYANHFSGQETILRSWHNQFPPNAAEEQRNQDIFSIQNNRNPFIDYPQLEERITSFVGVSTAPQIFGLDILQSSINFGNVVLNTPDTFDYVMVNRGSRDIQFSNFSLSNTNDLSFAAGSGQSTTLIPGEALQVSVIVNTSANNLSETLSFNTNIPGGQSSFSIAITATGIVIGIDESNPLSAIEMYPNPASQVVFLKDEKQEKFAYEIRDAGGKLIQRERANAFNYEIPLEEFSKGLYFIEIKKGKQSEVRPLVVQ